MEEWECPRGSVARYAPGRNRTYDLSLRRRTLYPLSYGRASLDRSIPRLRERKALASRIPNRCGRVAHICDANAYAPPLDPSPPGATLGSGTELTCPETSGKGRPMIRTIRMTAAALAVAVASLTLVGAASAHTRGIAYEFRGTAVVAPGTGATQIQVQVTGGNRPALKALLGAAQPTTFTTDAKTRWIAVNGNTPVLAASDTVLAGDVVRVVVRAPWHTPLSTLVATPAASVTDLSAAHAARRSPLPLRRHRLGHRHDRAHDHGRRQLRQLARALRPARPAAAPDVHLRREHRVPEVAPRRADRRRPERHPRRRPAHAARLRPGLEHAALDACSPRRSGASSSASRWASPCATARSCPAPDPSTRGAPLTPHPQAAAAAAAHPPPSTGPAERPAPCAFADSQACSLPPWSDSGHRGG